MEKVIWADLELCLLPEKAVYVPSVGALLVADLHLGKEATFRARGIPIPDGSSASTLAKLSTLIEKQKPRSVHVLGDLFHGSESKRYSEQELFANWVESIRPVDVIWILGNHDRWVGKDIQEKAPVTTCRSIQIGNIWLRHEPIDSEQPAICGHLHPGFRLEANRRSSETLPCFWVKPDLLTIPAFGDFTGLYKIDPEPLDHVFVIAGSKVLRVPR